MGDTTMNHLLVIIFVASTQAALLAPILKVQDPVINSYIVKFKDGGDMDILVNAISESVTVKRIYTHVFHGVAVEAEEAQIENVAGLDFVEYIEEDAIMKKACEWGVDRINQRNLPLDGRCNLYGNGAGAHVYIVDTGIRYTHVEFGGRAQYFWDFDSGNYGSDCHGHGTHVAATVAGSSVGIANGATVHSVRVINCMGGSLTSNIIAGLNAIAASGRRPGVCAVCFCGGASSAFDNAVRDLIAAGYPTVVAACNDNANACSTSPGRVAEAETVGSTTSTDVRSGFSNFGSCLDLFAPGSNVRSAYHTSDIAYSTMSGTSMACAHVAGCLALHMASGACSTGPNCKARLADEATYGVISNPGSGSPNNLLYCS